MRVYLGKERECETGTMTATHITVTGLTRMQTVGHKLYIDNFFLLLTFLMIYILRP